MRTIDHIVIHCSATREDRSLTVAELEENHRCRGFRGIGYHYYIRKDGTVINTRALELVGAHAKGHNSHSIGICYEGGLDVRGGLCPYERRCGIMAIKKSVWSMILKVAVAVVTAIAGVLGVNAMTL